MMHRFQDSSIGYLNTSTALASGTLESYLDYLVKNNYTVLSFKNLILSAQANQEFYKTVCFTIDDGYIDFKNVAFPLFKKYKLPATVFITTGLVENKLMMWWDQVEYLFNNTEQSKVEITLNSSTLTLKVKSQEEKRAAIRLVVQIFKLFSLSQVFSCLQRLSEQLDVVLPDEPPKQYSALRWADIREMKKYNIDFQPHTVAHPVLSRIGLAEQEWQIKVSSDTIRERLNSNPIAFCYPNGLLGDYTADTISILKRTNFMGACSSERGFFNSAYTDLFNIPRFALPKKYYKFVLYVSGCRFWQLAMQEKIKNVLVTRKTSRQVVDTNNRIDQQVKQVE
ncbi:polysaccharide deacetylase family protein [Desulfogranum marinum]|uniref:polysaccharide deacetylase family protein n=1 Tax=Desulfogranum marinum TaxID=453220 RepID=UPI0029C72496|nr:polysaccharide deacetylase family protein [Desulfogranum marinum]